MHTLDRSAGTASWSSTARPWAASAWIMETPSPGADSIGGESLRQGQTADCSMATLCPTAVTCAYKKLETEDRHLHSFLEQHSPPLGGLCCEAILYRGSAELLVGMDQLRVQVQFSGIQPQQLRVAQSVRFCPCLAVVSLPDCRRQRVLCGVQGG